MPTATLARTFTVMASAALSACASISANIPESSTQQPMIPDRLRNAGLAVQAPPIYLRSTTQYDERMGSQVTVNSPDITLAEVLAYAVPDIYPVSMDTGVDMGARTRVVARNMPLGRFLEYLGNNLNLDFKVVGDAVEIRSEVTKEWNMSALASNHETVSVVGGSRSTTSGGSSGSSGSSSGSGGRGSSTIITTTEDEWDTLIEDAQAILDAAADNAFRGDNQQGGNGRNASLGANTDDEEGSTENTVVGVRTLGLIRATGKPNSIRKLSLWMDSLKDQSAKQVHMNVQVLEVGFNDKRATGINWNTVMRDLRGLTQGALEIGTGQAAIAAGDLPAFNFGFDITARDDTHQAFVELLGEYGRVELVNEPNVTVINGRTANISSGREFSFITEFQQTQSGTSGFNTVTASHEKLLIGVTLAVTPRVLDDDRIMIDVVPVISTLEGFSNFSFGDQLEVTLPETSLQELSTQVIARSGQTIQLGGLIGSRLVESASRIPRDDNRPGIFDWLAKNVSNELEKRELVITITPTLIES